MPVKQVIPLSELNDNQLILGFCIQLKYLRDFRARGDNESGNITYNKIQNTRAVIESNPNLMKQIQAKYDEVMRALQSKDYKGAYAKAEEMRASLQPQRAGFTTPNSGNTPGQKTLTEEKSLRIGIISELGLIIKDSKAQKNVQVQVTKVLKDVVIYEKKGYMAPSDAISLRNMIQAGKYTEAQVFVQNYKQTPAPAPPRKTQPAKPDNKQKSGQGAIKKSDYEFWYEVGFGAGDADSAKWKENYEWAKKNIVDVWKADNAKMPALCNGMNEMLLTSLIAYGKSMEGDFLGKTVDAEQAAGYLIKAIETMKKNNWLDGAWTPANGFSKDEATVLLTLMPLVYRNRINDLVSKNTGKSAEDVACYIYDASTKTSQFAKDSFSGARNLYIKQSELNTQRAEIIAGMAKISPAAPIITAPKSQQISDTYDKLADFVNDPAVKMAIDVLEIKNTAGTWNETDFAKYKNAEGKYDVNSILDAVKVKGPMTLPDPTAVLAVEDIKKIVDVIRKDADVPSALTAAGIVEQGDDGKYQLTESGANAVTALYPDETKQKKIRKDIVKAAKKGKMNDNTRLLLEGMLVNDLSTLGINKGNLEAKTGRNVEETATLAWFNKAETLESAKAIAVRNGTQAGEIQRGITDMTSVIDNGFIANIEGYANAAADAKKVEKTSFDTLGGLLEYDTSSKTTQNLLNGIRHGTDQTLDNASAIYEQLVTNGKEATAGKYTQASVKAALDDINKQAVKEEPDVTPASNDESKQGEQPGQPPSQQTNQVKEVVFNTGIKWIDDLSKDPATVEYFNKISQEEVTLKYTDDNGVLQSLKMPKRNGVIVYVQSMAENYNQANEKLPEESRRPLPVVTGPELLEEGLRVLENDIKKDNNPPAK